MRASALLYPSGSAAQYLAYRFEARLGFKLFVRTHRGLKLKCFKFFRSRHSAYGFYEATAFQAGTSDGV